jgi:hypothetical protein
MNSGCLCSGKRSEARGRNAIEIAQVLTKAVAYVLPGIKNRAATFQPHKRRSRVLVSTSVARQTRCFTSSPMASSDGVFGNQSTAGEDCMSRPKLTRRGLVTGLGAGLGLAATSRYSIGTAHSKSLLEDLDALMAQPLPPKSDSINGHVPDLSGLARDDMGIINQLEDSGKLDGGDSAHRTGFAAFLGNQRDSDLLPLFESNGVMVRHPTQVPWNNWKNCTRDQLIGYAAGCWRAGRLDINQRLLDAHKARIPPFTCQDTENDYPGTTKKPPIGDLLGPHDMMYLRISAGDNSAYTDRAGQLALEAAIIYASTQDVQVDQNNLILHSILCGRLNLLVKEVPKYEESIRYYWSGWRKQPRIAEEFIWVIREELKRYR